MPNKNHGLSKPEAWQLYADYLGELWHLYCEMEQVEFSLRDLRLEYKFDRHELAQIRNDASKKRTSSADAAKRRTSYAKADKRKNKTNT